MGKFLGLLWIWFAHTVIGGVLAAPLFLWGRRRGNWSYWELLVFVVPFGVCTLLMFSSLSTGRKSLANLAEPFYFALIFPTTVAGQISVGKRLSAATSASLVVATVAVAEVVIFFVTPSLPE